MPELPEIVCRAREMNVRLAGRTIREVAVAQPKCLNVPIETFRAALRGARVREVTSRGKWLFVETTRGHLLLNLGMGGEILLVAADALPATWRVRFDLDRSESLSVNFWWFGYAHFVPLGELARHTMTASLGPDALGVSSGDFRALLDGRRGAIKPFLLDQKRLAGIGNAYIHDILFRARLHPLRTISSLSAGEVDSLCAAIRAELERSIALGAASYEVGLDGKGGSFTAAHLLVGYREGKPCPTCGTLVEKLRTGSTSSFLCPRCQPLAPGSKKRAKRPSKA